MSEQFKELLANNILDKLDLVKDSIDQLCELPAPNYKRLESLLNQQKELIEDLTTVQTA